jgi:2-oxoglutarate dehydrogenase E2 component (dihydrolipoamide succinyltransferase)
LADIKMPQLGETVTEGTIIKWLKAVGDAVATDEPLFEVSTDKVDSEVPSPETGFLEKILVPEGETVDVGTRIAVISASAPAPGAAPAPAAAAPAPAAKAAAPPPAAAAEAATAPEPPPAPAAEPAPSKVREPAEAAGAPAGNGSVAGDGAAPGSATTGLLLSPVVRRLIDEHGIDPTAISGTGAGGRITRGDVLAYIDSQAARGVSAEPARPPAGAAATAAAALAPAAGGHPAPAPAARPAAVSAPYVPGAARDEVVAFTNIRRRTAEHMVRSKATSAHTLVAIEADYEGVEKVRRQHKDRFKSEEGISLTYLPFVARAVIETIRSYPHLNASVGEDALIVHHDIHLAVAVDLDQQGLIAPVIHHADGQSLRGIARAVSDLAARARTRKLSADDIAGGTFTITNPGPFGTFITAPIINQPQVAILSTDGIKRRPVVVELPDGSEAIAIHSVGLLALSFDHRAVDGAYASAFVRDVARVIETRDWAAEL